jgi:hypothetical protein
MKFKTWQYLMLTKTHNNRTLQYCWRKNGMLNAENRLTVCLLNFNISVPCDLVIPLLDIYTREIKICLHKNLNILIYNSYVHDCQKMETARMSFADTKWLSGLKGHGFCLATSWQAHQENTACFLWGSSSHDKARSRFPNRQTAINHQTCK